jgi:8-oxo-dGTP pyrophosphatase MutT (NUDIX family)
MQNNNAKLKIKYEVSAGGIVYKKSKIKSQKFKIKIQNSKVKSSKLKVEEKKAKVYWLVVQHSQHKGWVFPKGLIGDIKVGEKMEEAALREVEEEGGVKARIVYDKPVKVEYTYRFGDYLVKKTVYYFLMEYISGDPKNHDWEVSDAKFLTEEAVKKILTYPSDKKAFEKILLIFKNHF